MRINALDESNYQSPYRLYALAEIHIQWAFCRMKFGEYVAAVTDIKRAYKLLEQNTALFPEFKANKKNLGILHALVGTVPDEFKWAVKMLGMNGTIEQGGSELETLLSETSDKYLFHKEAQVYYAYFLLHLNNEPDKAWQVLQSSNLDPSQSLAASFVFANVAMHTMQNDLALSYLENRPRGAAYIEFPYLDFMAGVAKLQQLDTAAQAHLETFIAHPTVRHYKKEAYPKIGLVAIDFLWRRSLSQNHGPMQKKWHDGNR